MIKNFITLLFILSNTTLLYGMSPVEVIFPIDVGSYWVYTDKDGNELIRRLTTEEEIDGKKYKKFEYRPILTETIDLQPLIHVDRFDTDGTTVTYYLTKEFENSFHSKIKKELDMYELLAESSFKEIYPAESGISIDIKYEVKVDIQNKMQILNMIAAIDQEWKVTETNVFIKIIQDIQGIPNFANESDNPESILHLKISETARSIGPETIVLPAGQFDNCKKVEYRTKTEIKSDNNLTPELKAGETVTTIWFAPHVGIVKIQQESNKVFLNIFAESEMVKNTKLDFDIKEIFSPTIKTLELKKYKINSPHMEDE